VLGMARRDTGFAAGAAIQIDGHSPAMRHRSPSSLTSFMLVRTFAHLAGKHDETAVGIGRACDLDPRRRPGERTGFGLGERRKNRDRIDAALAGVPRERTVTLTDRHGNDVWGAAG